MKINPDSWDSTLFDVAATYLVDKKSIWDVGANVGAFAFSAPGGSKVVAVEADPFLVSLLHRPVLLNPDLNVTVLCAAIADKIGVSEFQIAERGVQQIR